ncbi:MAG TPA: MFS transporter [Balneolaceae bacterium]|nr:MFS transporter [Balneolaceae bacterium]
MPHPTTYQNSESRIPRATFAGLAFAGLAVMLGRGILLPILPNLAKQLGASSVMVGGIFAGYALASGIFSPLFGRISDQYGRKNIMTAGLFFYAMLSFGYIWVHHLWMLAIIWFLQGLAAVMVRPIAQSYIGDITPEGKEGRVMNLFYFVQFAGPAIGPVTGGFLTDHVSKNSPFYVMGGVAVAAFLVVIMMVPEAPSVDEEGKQALQLKKSFKTVFKDPNMKGILSYLFGRGFYRRGFNAFFPIYAVTIASLSQSQVGLILSCYMLTGLLLQYPFGWLSDRIMAYRPELVGIGGLFAGLTMFVFPSLRLLSGLIILVIIKGIFSTFSRAPTVAIRTERGRHFGMGAVTGVSITAMSVGQILGPVGFGAMSDLFNIKAAFYFGGFAALLTTALAYWYLRFTTQTHTEAFVNKQTEKNHS